MPKNNTTHFLITAEEANQRIDKFLADALSASMSRAFIQKLIDGGDVQCNGAVVNYHHKLREGDDVTLLVPPPKPSAIVAEKIALDVIYEDSDLMVINKPADMVVHPAPGNYQGTLVNALLGRAESLSSIGGEVKPGIVHRIDKGTSGILLVAKTDAAHASLARQFKHKTIKKVYIAVVKGVVELDNGIVDAPIGRSRHDRLKMSVDLEGEKEAETRYKVLERFRGATLLEIRPTTGRTHQIRVHMAHIDHPLIGDVIYGGTPDFGRPALHARSIGFMHPSTKKRIEFSCELPDDIEKLIKTLRAKTKAALKPSRRTVPR